MVNWRRSKNIVVEKSPIDYGIKRKKWSGPILLRIIKEKFGVDYKPTQAYKLIERIGLQFKKGKGIEMRK